MTMREYVASFPVVVLSDVTGFKWCVVDHQYIVNAEYAKEFNETRERLIRQYETEGETMDEQLQSLLRSALASRKSAVSLAQIMGEMEKTYAIPMLKRNVQQWLAGNRRNAQVLAVYRCVSGMRSV